MLKLFGALLMFSACTLFGFYKAHELKSRTEALKSICSGLDLMYIQINSGQELPCILKRCFKECPDIICNGYKVTVNPSRLKNTDIMPLDKLFSTLGQSDTDGELKKISLCKAETEKNLRISENAYNEGAKLRQSLGICAGLALGIMVI